MASPPLPSFLLETAPLEAEDIPLQVALLTMEVASLRDRLTTLAWLLRQAGEASEPPAVPDYGVL